MSRRLVALVAIAALPVAVLGVFFVLPVAGMLVRGFAPEGHLDLAGVAEVLGRERVRRVLGFTLFTSAAGTSVSLLIGVPVAHLVHRTTLPGRRLLRAFLLVPFVLPTVVVGMAFTAVLSGSGPLGGLGLAGTPTAIVAALAFFNTPLVVRTVGAAWESMDPRPAEAAAALGASPARVFRTVTLPALLPAIVSAASVVFLFCATAFGVVLTMGGLRYATVETEIYLLTMNYLDLQAAAALSVIQLAVVLVLLVVLGRIRPPVPVARRLRAAPERLGARHLPGLLALAVLAVLVALPLGTLVVSSLRGGAGGAGGAAGGSRGWSLAAYRALADPPAGTLYQTSVAEALANSLRIAADATWIALLLGLLVALVVTRPSRTPTERRLRRGLDGLFMLPLGVSAVTVGFGFLITLNTGALDLRTSPILVPLAQGLVALPLVVRTIAPVLAGIDDRQRQAAASLGASPWRTALSVDLPTLWRPLVVATGFCYAVSLGEFGATAFLVRGDAPTLPVVIYDLLSHPGQANESMAVAASVLLAALTTAVVVGVERLRPPGTSVF